MTTETMITTAVTTRTCAAEGCDTDISHHHITARYCTECSIKRQRANSRSYSKAVQAAREAGIILVKEAFCMECGEDISHRRGSSERCETCAWEHNQRRDWARREARRTGQSIDELLKVAPKPVPKVMAGTGVMTQIPAHAWGGGLVVKTCDNWLLS
jgi:hypothetical protein